MMIHRAGLIELVVNMLNLKLTAQQCIEQWDEISGYVEILSEPNLAMEYGIPRFWFDIQDGMNKLSIKLANATYLDKYGTKSVSSLLDYFRIEDKVTLSKHGTETINIENQGDTDFCWLFAAARSIVQSMWMRKGSFSEL